MSEQDENLRSGGGGGFSLSSPKAPGRLSVLQASKKENLPLGSPAPAAKVRGSVLPRPQVTFQTPLCDPPVLRPLRLHRREVRADLDSAERPPSRRQAQAHGQQLPEEAESGPARGPQDAVSGSEPGCGDPACAPLVDSPPPSPPRSPVSVDLPVTGGSESVLPPAEPPKSSLDGSKASGDLPSQQVLAAATGSIPGLASAKQAPKQIAGAQNQGMPLKVQDASAPLSHQDSELEPPTWDPEDEVFRDAAEVLGTCVEVDYLEQFGASSLKDSSLRKQSLFLQFDPLLKDSPVRRAPSDSQTSAREQPVPLATPQSRCLSEAQLMTVDLLGSLDVPVPKLPPRVPCTPIMDKLQCSQKDMDAGSQPVTLEQMEAALKKQEAKVLEMGMIMKEYEKIAYHAVEEAEKLKEEVEKQKELVARVESQKAEQQATMKKFILNSLKNEESLKKSLELCMAHLDRERQRYQALKAQAEEKLRLANSEIARPNNCLHEEQIRRQALEEKALEQEALENEN